MHKNRQKNTVPCYTIGIVFFIYMLTEQQKNYLSMLLVGDALIQDEIRRFLARSGWSIEQIDAGIAFSEEAKKKSVTTSNQPIVTNLNVSAPAMQMSMSTDRVVSTGAPSTPVKSYNEPITTADLQQSSIKSPDLGYLSSNQSTTAQKRVSMSDMKVPLIQTMPTVPKEGPAKQILSFIAWLLFIVLIVMVLGLGGYMYYMHLGPFASLTYTAVF